jgi:hypothetical protein
LDFGIVAVGGSLDRTFLVRNIGCEEFIVRPSTNCGDFLLPGGAGAFSLAPAEERAVTVRFQPTACEVAPCIVALGVPGCPEVACTGTAGGLVCSVAPTSLDFGTVSLGEMTERGFMITNGGCEELTGEIVSRCPEFSLMEGGGPYRLGPGQSRSVVVRFTPAGGGPRTCGIRAGNDACDQVTCSGIGGEAACAVVPQSVDFGSVGIGSSADRSLTITSTGTDRLRGTLMESCGAYEIVDGAGSFDLAPGEELDFTIRFAPTECGIADCSILTGNIYCGEVSCTGAGTAAGCTLEPAGLDFGSVSVGDSADRTVTLRNEGCSALSGTIDESCPGFEVVGGGGQFVMAAGDSQVVTIRFTPADCEVVHCAIGTGLALCPAVDCAGAGTGVSCVVDPNALDFGSVDLGLSADRSFSITNTGCGPATGTVSASCADYTILTGGGVYALAAGETRAVTVRFTPSGCGEALCRIETGSASCDDVDCAGSGAGAGCVIAPDRLDFGDVAVGASADRDFTITNTGCETITGAVTESCGEFSLVAGGGNYTLAPAESRPVTVRFTPSGCGTKECLIGTGSVPCPGVVAAGTGGGSVCTIDPGSLTFGDVPLGLSAERTFTITNGGCADLVGSVTESCSDYEITAGGGSYRVAAGASRTVTVRFAPSGCGSRPCTIQTGDAACNDMQCSGNGTGERCSVSPLAFDFGTVAVGSHADRTFILTNTGCTLLAGSISESCPDYSIVAGGGPYTLSPGTDLTVTIRFAPTDCGIMSCTIETGSVFCDDVGVSGIGGGSRCVVVPERLSFGEVPVGEVSDRTFTIKNDGCVGLAGAVAENCSDYSILQGGGGYDLAPGESLEVAVRFAPTGCGTRSCTIDTGHTDCADVPCDGEGTGLVCSVTPTTLNFGSVPPGSSAERTFTITNAGCDRLIGSVEEDCPDYSIVGGGGAYDLGSGENLTVHVRFSPLEIGIKTCMIDLGLIACEDIECLGCSAPASPQLVYASADATIRSLDPDWNGCLEALNQVGNDGVSGELRTLLSFDLSGIPPGARVTGVRLDLYAAGCDPAAEAVDVVVHRLDGPWDECSVDWNNAPPSTPRTCSGTIFCDAEQYYLFNCSNLIPVVQSWIDDPTVNHGLMIVPADEQTGAALLPSHRHPDTGKRPRMRVSFSCP